MYCESHDKAMKQAKANANLNQQTWVVFSHAGNWYCEPLSAQSMTKTLVFPDSEPEFDRINHGPFEHPVE